MQNMEEIYKEYFETVKKYLFCLTHNNDIAEELTQETFYKAVKNIHTFKDDCKISVWLCKIAKNTWLDSIKKNKNIKDMADNELFEIESLETTDETVISNQGKLELYKKIQKLDEKTRDVIYLRITGDLNFKEIGDIFNKTENWARITFYRGKQKIDGGEEKMLALVDMIRNENKMYINMGRKEGIKEGKKQTYLEIAKNLLKLKMPISQISEITKLPKEEIEKLK